MRRVSPKLGPNNIGNVLATTGSDETGLLIVEFIQQKAIALRNAYAEALPFLLKISTLRVDADIGQLRSEFLLLLNNPQFQEFRRKVVYLKELDTQFDKELQQHGIKFGINQLIDAPASIDDEIHVFLANLEFIREAGTGNAEAEQDVRSFVSSAERLRGAFERTITRMEEIEAHAVAKILGVNRFLSVATDATSMLRRSPWFSGAFYLTCFATVIAVISIAQRVVEAWSFPLVLAAGIVATTLIGAFQLRNDDRLSEAGFLKLVQLSFKSIFEFFKRAQKPPTQRQ